MKVQKLPPTIGITFILLLGIICFLDPVRNYPTQTISVVLAPGEEISINRPTQVILPLGLEKYIYPPMYIWFISHGENITVIDYNLHARADVLYELYTAREYYTVRNDDSNDKRIEIKTIYAPSPENQDDYRNYLYILTGFTEILILIAYTLLNGATTIKSTQKKSWFKPTRKAILPKTDTTQ